MDLYIENIQPNEIQRIWNYCHHTGFAGTVHEFWTHDGFLMQRTFYVDGMLHRPVADGPAVETFTRAGDSSKQYYERGQPVGFSWCSNADEQTKDS